jgi:hypothetical protein
MRVLMMLCLNRLERTDCRVCGVQRYKVRADSRVKMRMQCSQNLGSRNGKFFSSSEGSCRWAVSLSPI